MILRAPSQESQHIETNLIFLYRSSPARSLSLSSASGQLVHLVVQKSVCSFCDTDIMILCEFVSVLEEAGNDNRFAYRATRHVDDCNSPMTVFWPENAALEAVNSAFPRLVRGRFGNLGEEALMVAWFLWGGS